MKMIGKIVFNSPIIPIFHLSNNPISLKISEAITLCNEANELKKIFSSMVEKSK